MRRFFGWCVGGVLCAAAGTASASTVDYIELQREFHSTSGTSAQFTGEIAYGSFTSPDSQAANLRITLTNTTSASLGGYITGFVFNVDSSVFQVVWGSAYTSPPDDQVANLNWNIYNTSSSNPDTVTQFSEPVSASPFGSYDVGVGVGNGPWNGGSTSTGLGVNHTGTFYFNVSGFSVTTAEQFFVARDGNSWTAKNGTVYEVPFAVRFQSMAKDASDKVIGDGDYFYVGVDPDPTTEPIPLPLAAWGGLALMGLVITRKLRGARA